MLFCYKVNEMLWELNSRLYRSACGKVGFITRRFAAFPRTYRGH